MKTSTITLRVEQSVKNDAEKVLKSLGLTMSTAIDMYLKQISLTQSIPFEIKIPNKQVNDSEIISLISEAIEDYRTTKQTYSVDEVFNKYESKKDELSH